MYTWIPAGAIPPKKKRANVYLYVKYGRTGINNIDAKFDKKTKRTWIKTPDRELLICGDQKDRPLDENYDECLNLSLYDDEGIGSALFDYTLISAPAAMQKRFYNRDFISDNNKVSVFCDSGGAQLKFGSCDFIDPYDVIKVYNGIADIGASLDVPPRFTDHVSTKDVTKVIKTSMFVQKKNNAIFLKEKRPGLKLLNVSHGFTFDQVKAWCDYVDQDGFYGWAAGADNLFSQASCLLNIIVPFKYHSGSFFHLFGISGRAMIPILAWMGKYIPHISTDSTTYYIAYFSRKMLLYNHTGDLRQVMVGKDNRAFNPMLTIPCNCCICSKIKYLDLFTLDMQYNTVRLLSLHNLLILREYTQTWNYLAHSYTIDEYKAFIKNSFKLHGNSLVTLLDFVEEALHNSPEAAVKRFKHLLGYEPTRVHSAELPGEFWDSTDENQDKNTATNFFNNDSALKGTLPNYLNSEEKLLYL